MRLRTAAFIALAVASQPVIVNGQSLRERTEAEHIYLEGGVRLDPLPAEEAFVRIVRGAGRPGGVILRSGCNDSAEAPLFAPSVSLASALDLLTAVHPAYHWTIEDGAILLLPSGKLSPVMDVQIEAFEWNNAASVHFTVNRLVDAPPVRRCLRALGFEGGVEALSLPQQAPRIVNGKAQLPPQGRQFHIENVRLLAALNAVAASYGRVVWYFEERACGGPRTYSFSAH